MLGFLVWNKELQEEFPQPGLSYKVCDDPIGCRNQDILTAFNDAISNGVDSIQFH